VATALIRGSRRSRIVKCRRHPELDRVAFAGGRTIQYLFGDTCLIDRRAHMGRQIANCFVKDIAKQTKLLWLKNAIYHHALRIRTPG
jgi:hypothetical protein